MNKNINKTIDFYIEKNPSENPKYFIFPIKNSKKHLNHAALTCTHTVHNSDELLKKMMILSARFSGQGEVLCHFLSQNQQWHKATLQWDMKNDQVDSFTCHEVDELDSSIRTIVILDHEIENKDLTLRLTDTHPDLLIIHITHEKLKFSYGANYLTDELELFCQHIKDVEETESVSAIKASFLTGPSTPEYAYNSLFGSFENSVTKHPDKCAIITKKLYETDSTQINENYHEYSYQEIYHQVLSYAEVINNHSNNKQTIAIFLPRNIEQIITTLASHALGCIVVPIYFDSPIERVKQQIQKAGCHLAIVKDSDIADISNCVKCLSIENIIKGSKTSKSTFQSKPSFINPLSLEEVSYIYFTSGSEGNPKGVTLPGKSFSRLLDSISFVEKPSEQIFSYIANPAFDASALELWGAFINSATLVVIEKDDVLDIDQLLATLKQHHVTTSFFTTGLFNRIVDTKVNLFDELNTVIFGGEKASSTHLKKALLNSPQTNFINGYGPTENGIFTTTFKVTIASKEVPIGKPVNGTQVAVVDKHHNVLPQGLVGQLVCFGDGLSLGYVNESILNAKKFLNFEKNLLDNNTGYLTGDYVRLNASGNLEFIGRIDSQIKLNGFRIELGEIENILTQNENVQSAYVRFCHLSKQIQVFAVTDQAKDELLANFNTLPNYMHPKDIYIVDDIPLNANGKVNQYMLNDHVKHLSEQHSSEDPLQEHIQSNNIAVSNQALLSRVMGVYEKILRQPVSHPELTLFEMGGNSLHLMQLLSDIRTTFNMNYELSYLAKKSSPMDVMCWISLQNWNSQNKNNDNESQMEWVV